MPLITFLAALDRHGRMFDLSTELGDELLEVAVHGVTATFTGEAAPDGTAWGPLSSEYARVKSKRFPGRPMGIATGDMREGLAGERALSTAEARWTFGQPGDQRNRAVWFQLPTGRRQPERKFCGFTEDSVARSKEVLTTHFKGQV